jgi:hypothetical protein
LQIANNQIIIKKVKLIFEQSANAPIFAIPKRGELSSAGSEYSDYIGRGTGQGVKIKGV